MRFKIPNEQKITQAFSKHPKAILFTKSIVHKYIRSQIIVDFVNKMALGCLLKTCVIFCSSGILKRIGRESLHIFRKVEKLLKRLVKVEADCAFLNSVFTLQFNEGRLKKTNFLKSKAGIK